MIHSKKTLFFAIEMECLKNKIKTERLAGSGSSSDRLKSAISHPRRYNSPQPMPDDNCRHYRSTEGSVYLEKQHNTDQHTRSSSVTRGKDNRSHSTAPYFPSSSAMGDSWRTLASSHAHAYYMGTSWGGEDMGKSKKHQRTGTAYPSNWKVPCERMPRLSDMSWKI